MVVNRYWVIILLAAVGLGVWRGQPLLTLGGLFGLLIAGAEILWDRYCLTGLEYERKLSASRAVWGDDVTLSVRLANRKILPLTWLKTEELVPLRLPMPHARVVDDPEERRAYLRHLLPMLPYEQVIRRYTVSCRRRGLFQFGPARLESGDLLGWTVRELKFPRVSHLLVYPKLFELDMPVPLSRRIIGEQAARRVILTDPSRTVGVRSYQPGDPLHYIEWRASARSRELLVRVFEPTTDLALAIFLNFRVPSLTWISDGTQELEFCISLAASVARWSLDRKYPAGMFGNGSCGEEGALRIPVSSDPEQLTRILEALALAGHHPGAGIAEVLLSEVPRLPFEASAVLITAGFDYGLLAAIDRVRRQRPLTVLFVKTTPAEPPSISGMQLVTIEYDDYWEQQDHVQLAA
jgi:uncharacterized protein (DUF58 family)